MLRWSGSLPHAATLERIAAADLLCLPSADESFALAPMEAAALGVPVLLTRLPVYPHIGWRDGENCLQYRPGDLRGLEEQIRRLAADAALRERLARHGRKLAGKYPLEKTLRTLSGVLQAQFSKTAPR
jgi:glycosyltransferase involved in cell wall biosynthesis